MANDAPQAAQSVESKATSLSEKMDRAVAEDNRGAYDNSMREINEARSQMQPARQQKFDETLAGSLEFQTAALYDMKRNYSNIDADGNSRLTKEELTAYADDNNTSPLQRAFINNHIIPNYDKISNISSDRALSFFMDDSEIRLKDLDQGLKNTDRMKHFYEKGADGQSLYDRFRDKDGNLDGFGDAIDDPKRHGLSDKDVETLKYIQDKRSKMSYFQSGEMKAEELKAISAPLGAEPGIEAPNEAMKHFYEPGPNGLSLYERFKDKDGNLSGFDQALSHPKEYGLSDKDIASLNYIQENKNGWNKFWRVDSLSGERLATLPGSDGYLPEERERASAKVQEQSAEVTAPNSGDKTDPKVETAVEKEPVPSDKLMELAKVRRGEGPYHSAERILSADGEKHSAEEVRAVYKALQQLYKEDGHGNMNDLRVNHQFITKENFKRLIKLVNNEKAREALKKLAAA